MATIVEKAARGQRAAMEALYQANKQKVYHIARSLLLDGDQAAGITAAVFREIWRELEGAGIRTGEEFTALAAGKAVELCKSRLYKKNPRAFRLPYRRDGDHFSLPASFQADDGPREELDYYLTNLPVLQRLLFVAREGAGWEEGRLARSLKFDAAGLRAALAAQPGNFDLLRQRSGGRFTRPYQEVAAAFRAGEGTPPLPPKVDQQAAAAIACGALCLLLLAGAGVYALSQREEAPEESGAVESGAVESDADESGAAGAESLDPDLVYYADIDIQDYGTVTVQLDQAQAPITCANFVALAEEGFYDGLTFHRIIEGFMMQGGDPNGDGTGGSGETIAGEFSDNGYDNTLSHTAGAISMARSNDYDSASSQFFIVQEDSTYLDGQYAVFGYVTEGMEVVNAIYQEAEPTDGNGTIPAGDQPVITSITIRTAAAQ